jgi:hypothetical protein
MFNEPSDTERGSYASCKAACGGGNNQKRRNSTIGFVERRLVKHDNVAFRFFFDSPDVALLGLHIVLLCLSSADHLLTGPYDPVSEELGDL